MKSTAFGNNDDEGRREGGLEALVIPDNLWQEAGRGGARVRRGTESPTVADTYIHAPGSLGGFQRFEALRSIMNPGEGKKGPKVPPPTLTCTLVGFTISKCSWKGSQNMSEHFDEKRKCYRGGSKTRIKTYSGHPQFHNSTILHK